MLPSLALAQHNLTQSAKAFQEHATACQELAARVKAAGESRPMHFDTSALARILEPLDICLVHRSVVIDVVSIVKNTQGSDSHEQDLLNRLESNLQQSLTPPTNQEL